MPDKKVSSSMFPRILDTVAGDAFPFLSSRCCLKNVYMIPAPLQISADGIPSCQITSCEISQNLCMIMFWSSFHISDLSPCACNRSVPLRLYLYSNDTEIFFQQLHLLVCDLRDKDMVLYVNKIDAFQNFKTVEFHAIPFIKPS